MLTLHPHKDSQEQQRSGVVAIVSSPRRLRPLSRFARDIFVFGWANIVALGVNGVLGFFLPRALSLEDFGYYRLFVLYSTIAGLLHLGMLEGVLVRWAENPGELIRAEIKSTLFTLGILQLLLVSPLAMALVWYQSGRWFWFGIYLGAYIFIVNVTMLGQIALQAKKKFNTLSVYAMMTPAVFLALAAAERVWGHLNARIVVASYTGGTLCAGFIVWHGLRGMRAKPLGSAHDAVALSLSNIRIGWKILLANFLVTFALSLDRFIVGGTLSIQDFAVYAFAGNSIAVSYTLAIAVAQVVYPYLNGANYAASHRFGFELGRALILAMWAISLVLYFPMAYLIRWILPKYDPSLPVIQFLMIGSGLVAIIYILHVNYFRLRLSLNRFLFGSVAGLSSITLLLLFARRAGSLVWIARGMTAGVATWWIINEILLSSDFKNSRLAWLKPFAQWLAVSAAFLITCSIRNLSLGCLAYILALLALLLLGFRPGIQYSYRRLGEFPITSQANS